MQPSDVINQLISRFEHLFPRLVFRNLRRLAPPGRDDAPYQVLLRFALPNGSELELGCLVLHTGYREEVERMSRRIEPWAAEPGASPAHPALLAPYLDATSRALLQRRGIAYLDLEGNLFVEAPRLWLLIERDAQRSLKVSKRVIQPFEAKAQRVARLLLGSPGTTWKTRTLASACGLSVGMTSMVTTELEAMEAVVKNRKGISLFDANILLDKWTEAYQVNENPFQLLRCDDLTSLKSRLAAQPQGAWAWTLWPAAECLLGSPSGGERLAFYWTRTIAALTDELGLSHEHGRIPVVVFQPRDESQLWDCTETSPAERYVSRLQLYLDLASGDDEELELARALRKDLF
ncbi:MAG: hypothetical protein GXY52_07440 [Chloroflexi bacterium]|nr:hypothetical protein [Chloroflexota bacterium]